jgi:hypothetical protein
LCCAGVLWLPSGGGSQRSVSSRALLLSFPIWQYDKATTKLLSTSFLGLPPHTMAPPITRARANWAVDRATGLPEVWALVAAHLGLVGAWRLMRVCRAARVGAREFLSTLPGLVVCGGYSGGAVRDVRRLDPATLRWEAMPALMTAIDTHACCAVRGTLVVLGGRNSALTLTSSVEMLSSSEEGAFVDLPPLSCGEIDGAAAIAVEESESAAGQVLLLGGAVQAAVSTVYLVDLATGVCTPGRPDMLRSRYDFAAGGLPGGGIVCVGGFGGGPQSAEVWEVPVQGAPDAAWTWRQLPAMSVARRGCRGCVMSDGRFAVLGGSSCGVATSSCVALTIGDDDEHWVPLQPMHDPRSHFACAAVAGCVIVAGGSGRSSVEVYDEVLDRWLRLPRDLPHALTGMASALL